MMGEVRSSLQNLAEIKRGKMALLIPSYQRPYVWSEEDVMKLMNDIVAAHDAKEPHYYIGTIVSTTESRSASFSNAIFELIDGQQRLTTLLLIAIAFSRLKPESILANFLHVNGAPRLTFAIREKVQALLDFWTGIAKRPKMSEVDIVSDHYLRPLNAGLKSLDNRFSNIRRDKGEEYLAGLGEYIFLHVKWVNNVMPLGMDVNRLFTTMNTGGIQLEQSDILKSLLLKKITREKYRYDAIWQACENMGNYFERNVRSLFPAIDWKELESDDLAEHTKNKFPIETSNSPHSDGATISELAGLGKRSVKREVISPTKEGDVDVYCRSTISFSLLLIHTFRIFKSGRGEEDISTRVIDSQLNKCFFDFVLDADATDATAFIECLWKVRYQFDRWVVKWVRESEEDEEHLKLASISKAKDRKQYRLNRSPLEISNLTQLQSVRYFSGERSAQYWLTSFLGKLVELNPKKTTDVEKLLERIDNQLSVANLTQKEASFALLSSATLETRSIESVCEYLAGSEGTSFEHYWFQKIEYVLWREQEKVKWYKSEKLRKYRITSKNSIEHVHPQKEKYDNKLEEEYLDSFGNLVLLSPGENSSYSNKPVPVKKIEFNEKPKYDSLKLAHMFHRLGHQEEKWSKEKITAHQEEMLAMLAHHYHLDVSRSN